MKIKHQDYNNVTVVELHGEFIEEYCKQFQDETSALVRPDMTGIVLDMSKVPFIDSKGLEQLLWLRDYCHESRSQLKLAGLDDNLAKIPSANSNFATTNGVTYMKKTVKTSRGDFSIDLLIADLSNPKVKILTDTAENYDCKDNCRTKKQNYSLVKFSSSGAL